MKGKRTLILLASFLFLSLGLQSEGTAVVFKKGDTLYSLARSYKVPPEVVAKLNGIKDPSKIAIGQKIFIPAAYTVKKGDTLSGIALMFGMDGELIKAANKIADDKSLKAGQTLYVIDTKGTSGAPTTAPAKDKPVTAAVMSWPVKGSVSYLDGKVYGVKITSTKGSDVRSVSGGTVITADLFRGYGQVVFVQHPKNYVYVYAGNETLKVKVGDKVVAGTVLGTLGIDPKEGKALAFFFVYKDSTAIDPAKAPR